MANIKLSELVALTAPAVGDYIPIVDVSEASDADKTKVITLTELSNWNAYTPTWTGSTTNPDLGNGTIAGRYSQIGKLVTVTVKMIAGTTTTFGSGYWMFSLPVNSANSGGVYVGSFTIYDSGANFYNGACTISANASVISGFHDDGTTSFQLGALTPITWANGDELYFTITYEAA